MVSYIALLGWLVGCMEQKTAALLLLFLFLNVKRPTLLHPGSFATPFLARVSVFSATEAEVKRESETPTDNPSRYSAYN